MIYLIITTEISAPLAISFLIIAWQKGDKQIIYACSVWNVMILVSLLDVAC